LWAARFAPSFFKYLAHGEEFRHAKRLEPRALDDLKRYDPEVGRPVPRSIWCDPEMRALYPI
jgi:hypothetical protein